MALRFLKGDQHAPKGHAIMIAHSSSDPHTIYSTYCIVPPIPMSLAKYLPPMFAAQLQSDELSEVSSIAGMPIPPMLEDGQSLEYLEMLAQHRSDDLCDIGTVNGKDDAMRVQMAALSCSEYGQLYANFLSTLSQQQGTLFSTPQETTDMTPLDDVDAEELLLQTMSERQKLAELGKLVGMARYALDGHDASSLQDVKQHMQRIVHQMPDKYRGESLVSAAMNADPRGARLAELYLSRAYKLLDEEYADIPEIERAIRDLQ